jgi:eukaryotic-like serine/threonine-protein kinase
MLETLGQYKILDRIGAGGMGDVYRARDTRLGRTVAIKVVSDRVAADHERRERLMHEARAVAALSHPNIAALYEVGEDHGHLFLAFEFVPGDTLKTVIAGRPLNARHAVEHAIQITDALAEAHAAGIVHRDIKPDSIMVTPKGSAKILDFGLSAFTAGGAERDAAAGGRADGPVATTIAYMSPEQIQGQPVDQRTDIFSFGVVLFEMLTGRRPFMGTTLPALSKEIVHTPAPPPSALNPDLRKDFDAILVRALAKKPEDRYEAAATLAAELRSVAAILDVRSGEAEPTSVVPVRAQRRRSRAPLVFGLFALGVCVALVALWIAGRL